MKYKSRIEESMRILGGQPTRSNAVSYVANEAAIKAFKKAHGAILREYGRKGKGVYIFAKGGKALGFVVSPYSKDDVEKSFEERHPSTRKELPVLEILAYKPAGVRKIRGARKTGRMINAGYKWVGVSQHSRNVERETDIAAKNDAYALITGETGVGKEVVARRIHKLSRRADKTFLSVNCGAIPENLAETEFFGHERGAFTGAVGNKRGYVDAADGGVLFLDEIGNMPEALQIKFFRFLEDGIVMPVGGTRMHDTDVRIIAATDEDVYGSKMRRELFYRLDINHIHIKPLRERHEDIMPIAEFYLGLLNAREGTSKSLSRDARDALQLYEFPGNVRELENILSYGFYHCGSGDIKAVHIQPKIDRNRNYAKKS